MSRRWVGVVLLVLVGFAAVALPNLGGRRVAGSPAVAFVPLAPTTGACVTALSPMPATDEDANGNTPVTYPSASYAPCAGRVLGEVMSVDPGMRPLATATVASYLTAEADCRLDAVNYAGSIGPFDPATIDTPGIAWQSSASVDSVAVGPTAHQRAAGQTWTACIGTTPDRATYQGHLVHALDSGVLPAPYAICWRSLPLSTEQESDEQLTPCASPHPTEVLGTTQITDPGTTTTQVDVSCLGFASRAMRTRDPTRGGVVTIRAYGMNGNPVLPLTSASLRAGLGYVGCIASVPPPRRLVGTLIGLADRPAPLTG